MRLLIRLDSLAPPRAGIGSYTENLCRSLLQRSDVEVTGIVQGRLVEGEALSRALNASSAVSASAWRESLKSAARAFPGAYGARQWHRDRVARNAMAGRDFDIYHEPNFVPFPTTELPTAITVHDLSHLRHPEFHPANRVRFLRRRLPAALKQASIVLCVSHFTASELIETFPEFANKVVPTPLGVSSQFCPLSRNQVEPVLASYGLGYKGYILTVATQEPRKNLLGLVRAYNRLADQDKAAMPLVLVGAPGWKNEALQAELRRSAGGGKIIVTGWVPRAHLPSLLNGARLFAYPSFYEGFGLPIAEARACGTPVLTSNFGAMCEVAGDQAYLVAPNCLEQGLRQALEEMPLTVEPFRFGWNCTAEQSLQAYSRAMAGIESQDRR